MLLPVIHRFLHGDFFELSRKSAIGRNLIFFFQHRTDNRAVSLIYRPYKRRTGIFSHPRIGSIKDVMVTCASIFYRSLLIGAKKAVCIIKQLSYSASFQTLWVKRKPLDLRKNRVAML